jgi:dipeptidyl aminopeptidase/acylaminoacyl peptidase
MRLHPLGVVMVPCWCGVLLAQTSGPDTRQLTDPRSVTSAADTQARAVPIPDLFYTRATFGASWSPDGKEIAFSTDLAGRLNLWKVSATGGWPVQLVQSDDRQLGATWSPDGKWILYQQDAGGNELWDIYAVPSDGGTPIDLTQTPDIREEAPRWSPDGKTIALNYKPKDGTVYDIALLDWRSHHVSRLTHETTPDRSWSSVAWSPDGKTLYANRGNVIATDAGVYAIDVATGAATDLTPHADQVLYVASSLSPDGKTLLVTSNAKNGYQNVALLDIATKKLSWATDTKWEAVAGDFSPTGGSFTYTFNADGMMNVYLVDRATMHATRLPTRPGLTTLAAYPTSFGPSGNRLLFQYESSTHPSDFWIYDVAAHATRQLTHSAIASLNAAVLPPARTVHYRTFDGKLISALLWMPDNLQRTASAPALVLPHGGPTGQMVDYWNPDVAALVSRGYICIAPNVRGSTGYGIDFQRANYKDLGGGDLQDEVYATRFLLATGYVDPKRIGITGGSYGGYMTLMAIGKDPAIWAAAVEEYGIINWETMVRRSDPSLQQYIIGLLGDPVKDRSVYDSTSPITFIHNVRAPLLVLQGDNDPRVPKEEAEQVVDLLTKDGKTVDAHYYPGEGHGFSKREDQIDAITRTVAWFDKYLHPAQTQAQTQ